MRPLKDMWSDRVDHFSGLPGEFEPQWYNRRAVTRLGQVSVVASAIAISIGLTVLAGWSLGLAVLTSMLPGFVGMNPTTAVCFILLGAGVCVERRGGHRIRLMVVAISLAVAAIAALKILSFISHFDVHVDQLFFREHLENVQGFPNRMAPNTAINMLFLALGVGCLPFRKCRTATQVLAILTFFVAMLAAVGYLCGAQSLYRIALFTPMALITAGVFMLLSLATLFAHPADGFMAVLSRNDTGGRITRRLLPLALMVLLILGILRLTGQRTGWYTTEVGTSLLTVIYMGVFSAIVMGAGWKLSRTERQRENNERALRLSEERFRNAIDHAPIGMALVDLEGKFMQVNHKLCRIVGMTEAELLLTSFQAITYPDDLETDLHNLAAILSGDIDSYAMEKRYFHKDGRTIWANLGVSMVRSKEGIPLYFISQIQDITEDKAINDKLLHSARHCSLTGLANRAAFTMAVQHVIDRKIRDESTAFAVLFIDLDRFKIINDSMGHLIGDELLQDVARKLLSCVRPTDLVSRLGGDEFSILLDHEADANQAANATRVAQRILTALAQPFLTSGKEIYTGASIGIALSLSGYNTPADILRDADNAMYRAKERGKGRYEIFDPAMHEAAVRRLDLEADLRAAVDAEQFYLCYQPIVYLGTGKARGVEALIRWNHPEKGTIGPGDFISIAEETALIVPMGRWVLREACAWIAAINEGRDPAELITINVNVSSRQFRHPYFVEEIREILLETKVPTGVLRLEITEGTIVDLNDTVHDVLMRLRGLGIQLQVDDFGTGYSSLAYLHRLPVDALKIDRSFVADLNVSIEAMEVIRAILALARGLGVDVVAEGVETEMQANALKEMGCSLAQGYYFARPLSSDAAKHFVLQ